jgi:HAMP domain-containing protein
LEPIFKDYRPRRNLRSLVIEPFKQVKFGLYVIGVSVAFVVVCAAMFVAAFSDQYQHVMDIFNVVDPSLKWELVTNDIFYANAVRIGLMFLFYISALFTVVFRLTHRYYGPLVSIERFLDQFAAGHYHLRAKIRDKDELHDLVAKLNHMAEELERRHGSRVGPAALEPVHTDAEDASDDEDQVKGGGDHRGNGKAVS